MLDRLDRHDASKSCRKSLWTLAVRPAVKESLVIDTLDVNDLDHAIIECDAASLSVVPMEGGFDFGLVHPEMSLHAP